MIRSLKSGRPAAQKAADAATVKASVEGLIADVKARGDTAVGSFRRGSTSGLRKVFGSRNRRSMRA